MMSLLRNNLVQEETQFFIWRTTKHQEEDLCSLPISKEKIKSRVGLVSSPVSMETSW